MDLTKQEKDDIAAGLNMLANFIETGDAIMSAQDASARKKPFKALDVDQMEKVVRLRRLAERIGGRQAKPQFE